ncbi:MAG: SUMF1/EgtB/PvdO family nonheme iron enzyme [Deltaproteobacteria bacterium]|nr:SUMF1/EgtB/PvdO family nonheme iron enzyme [Deltaproteobacteria bacterium]
MSDSPPTFRVFLSSTSDDLAQHREAVSLALRRMEAVPVQMETFGARPGAPVEECQRLAASADMVVALVAWRCGWVPDASAGGTGDRSITRLEIEAAIEAGKPVLAFLADDRPAWRGSQDSDDLNRAKASEQPAILNRVRLLLELREWLGKRYVRDLFTTPDSAASGVATAVHNEMFARLVDAHGATPASAPPDPASAIASWLAKVADDHAQLVSWFDEAECALVDQVYVELDVGLDERATRRMESLTADDTRHRDLASLLELDRRRHTWVTHRWVVLGNPGAGKTTMIRRRARELARDENRRWIPVFASLPELLRDKATDLLTHSLGRLLVSTPDAALIREALAARGRERGDVLFLLDGLDELSAGERVNAKRLIRALEQAWPACPVVVTSRAIAYERPAPSFREVRVQELDEARRELLLANWFGRHTGSPDHERARREWPKIADPALADLTSNPMYLTLFALLLEQGRAPDRNRAAIYDQVFELLYEGRHHQTPEPMPGALVTHEALSWLAYEHTRDPDFHQAEPLKVTEDRLLRGLPDDVRSRLREVNAHAGNVRQFLELVAARTAIYGPHDGRSRPWRYAHRTFREALASAALAAMSPRGDLDPLRAHLTGIAGSEDRWAEPYALLVGRVAEPDALLRALVLENKALGLRALATAQGVQPDTILAILHELSDGADNRAQVFARIPELVDDGERAVALIERIARETPSLRGEEFYFLHEALEAIATRHADVADPARRAQAHLYDRIPPPPMGLFERIETEHDGVVQLLGKVIEGGVPFLMGSPPEDDMAREDERPQHAVTITRSYRMMVVPVTNAMYRAFHREFAFETWKGVPQEALALHPAVNVSWHDAVAFCRWLSSRVPGFEGARLPTEAEWERAARGGKDTRYWSGDEVADLERVGWFKENSEGRTHRVAEKPQGTNDFGLYDIHGNVWEWTADAWLRDYRDEPATDPAGAAVASVHGEVRVGRGGSFWNTADGCRSACRLRHLPSYRDRYLGFRVLLPR